jgi:hypothetical protein
MAYKVASNASKCVSILRRLDITTDVDLRDCPVEYLCLNKVTANDLLVLYLTTNCVARSFYIISISIIQRGEYYSKIGVFNHRKR